MRTTINDLSPLKEALVGLENQQNIINQQNIAKYKLPNVFEENAVDKTAPIGTGHKRANTVMGGKIFGKQESQMQVTDKTVLSSQPGTTGFVNALNVSEII